MDPGHKAQDDNCGCGDGTGRAAGLTLKSDQRWWLRRVAFGVAAGVFVAAAAVAIVVQRIGAPALDRAQALSVTVLDRNDVLLRAFTAVDGRWRLPLGVKDVDPRYLQLLFAYEDKRFHTHWGFDGRALLRSGWQLTSRGRIVSGGSTITMQVARLLVGEHERTAAGKFKQIVRAIRLERRYSKAEILALYLTLAPFGGNIEGVRAASLAYLGKEPRRLSIAEAAVLVAIPQSPEMRRPDRQADAARRARDRVLERALGAGVISSQEFREAMAERSPQSRHEFPKLAPHLAEAEADADQARVVHRLTVDARAQKALEQVATDHAKALGVGISAAIIAVENTTGAVVAQVGSAGYFENSRAGAVDMTRAVRSPGSTLKPIIYGLAFEAGIAHPETLIEDRPQRFGAYQPKNFDHDFRGTVTVREALAQSLNIPAVKVLDALGPGRLSSRLSAAGAEPVLPAAAEPTLAIALGGLGLRLTDLAQLYVSLARQGETVALIRRRDGASPVAPLPARLLTQAAAWQIGDILKNAPAPANAKPGQIAYKTGTSYGNRDAWSVGFDGRHTIAVWVGRPDGAAVSGLSGRQSAAPVLFDAFQRLVERRTPLLPPPSGVLRVASGADLPPALRRFRDGVDEVASSGPFRETPVQIAFPIDRSEIEVEPGEGVRVKAEGGVLPLTWLVDGAPIATDPAKREATIESLGRGFVRLSVIDAKGRADRVVVRVR